MRRHPCSWLIVLVALWVPGVVRADGPKRHAGLEIGGSGVKITVLEVAANGTYVRIHGDSVRTDLTVLTSEGNYSVAQIAKTAKALKAFLERARTEFKVEESNIVLVGSSGVPRAKNLSVLTEAVRDATGRHLHFIDERTEVALTIAGIIPLADRPTSLSLDIGSGNTKGGYLPAGLPLVYLSVPLGAVTFAAQVREQSRKTKTPFAETARKLRDSELVEPFRTGARTMPGLKTRKKVYLSGGMVWAMVSHARPGQIDQAVVSFTPTDIEAFATMLEKAKGKHPEVDLASVKNQKVRERAEKELATVRKVYAAENLQAGVELLRALVIAFELKDREVVFPRNAAHGWLSAYVAGEKLEEKSGKK